MNSSLIPRPLIPSRLHNISNVAEHNFLINGILADYIGSAAERFARGTLVDIGCGEKPYAPIFAPHVERHIGVDIKPGARPGLVDIIGGAYATTLEDGSCDTVLCSEVLEHLEEPQRAVREMARVLRPGGHVILTVPFFWHVHEAPRDFYRYSEFGLRHLFEDAHFEVVEIVALTGFLVTFTQLSIYYVRRLLPRTRSLLRVPFWLAQHAGASVNRFDRTTGFTANYGLVARR